MRNIGRTDCTIGWTPDCPRNIAEEQPDQFPFVYDTCHKHWHFTGLAEYFLLDMNRNQVSLGAKNGLCLMDNTECPNTQFNCENQGISAGCADVYDRDLDCQWIDITGLPMGQYIFQWKVNNQRALPESNYDNNVAEVVVDLNTLERFNMDKGQVVGQCRERTNGRGTFRFTEGDPDSDPAAAAEESAERAEARATRIAERVAARAARRAGRSPRARNLFAETSDDTAEGAWSGTESL